jgi:ubiquinone/menaquinone biosynthesis C-methylase UbiE
MGRVIAPPMDYSGAEWLTRPTRETEENTPRLLDLLEIKRGQVVCDFGCGNGFHTLELAQLVGPQGRVDAIDVQPEMLDLLAKRLEARGVTNVSPRLAEPRNARMPRAAYDLVLMVDVYHELANPAGTLRQVADSLKVDGRLVLVEFREEDPGVPIKPLHKMSKPQIDRELSANGFRLVDQYDELPWQHVMAYCGEKASLAATKLQPWQPPHEDGTPNPGP